LLILIKLLKSYVKREPVVGEFIKKLKKQPNNYNSENSDIMMGIMIELHSDLQSSTRYNWIHGHTQDGRDEITTFFDNNNQYQGFYYTNGESNIYYW